MTFKTEDEARKCWCPFARTIAYEDSAAGNRTVESDTIPDNPTWARCIASECMAWRWNTPRRNHEGNSVGYCGLAGPPEGVT